MEQRFPFDKIREESSSQKIATEYDREKYLQLLLDAAETVLAPSGFDRRLLGDGTFRITDSRKELRKERESAFEIETKFS